MLQVNEIFHSIQGEGMYTGTPAIFIRLMGCPCHCPWCDTPHTWKAQDKDEVPFNILMSNKGGDDSKEYIAQWAWAEPHQIIEAITRLCHGGSVTHVVITGGEPLMQIQGISELLPHLYEAGAKTVQMETSGYADLNEDAVNWLKHVTTSRHKQLHITCSPKHAIDEPFFSFVSEWKFAIEDPISEMTLMALGQLQGHNYGRNFVYVQPVDYGDDGTAEASIKRAKNAESLRLAMALCFKYGYRLSLQTHKYIGVR